MEASEHAQVTRDARALRTAAARDTRAAGGPIYRKVPIRVTIITTVDQDGAPLTLATSDAPGESGRYLRLSSQSGR